MTVRDDAFIVMRMTNTKTTARRNRQTGTMIEVVPAAEFGVEIVPGELRYYTLCVDHNDMAGHPTKALAVSWAAEPLRWCHGCWTAYCNQQTDIEAAS